MRSPLFVLALLAALVLSAACGRATSHRASPPAGGAGAAGAGATGGAGGTLATAGTGGTSATYRVTGSIGTFEAARVANDEHVVTRQSLLAFRKTCSREHCVTGGIRP